MVRGWGVGRGGVMRGVPAAELLPGAHSGQTSNYPTPRLNTKWAKPQFRPPCWSNVDVTSGGVWGERKWATWGSRGTRGHSYLLRGFCPPTPHVVASSACDRDASDIMKSNAA